MKKGFTLAEVLITLGIIGIVAAMTLPALIQKHQEKVTVTKVKEAYSIISQAYFRAVEDNGADISNWGCFLEDSESNGGLCVMDKFAKFLNVTSSIRDGSDSVPFTMGLKDNDNHYFSRLHSIKLSNGFIIKFKSAGWTCNTYQNWVNVSEIEKLSCSVYVDINGEKGPNALGHDVFVFKIHKQTVSPTGNRTEPYFSINRSCNINTSNEFWENGVNGMSCTGWVIANENQEYLRCSGLSWSVKTKCK